MFNKYYIGYLSRFKKNNDLGYNIDCYDYKYSPPISTLL